MALYSFFLCFPPFCRSTSQHTPTQLVGEKQGWEKNFESSKVFHNFCMRFCICNRYVILLFSTSLFNPFFPLYFGPFKTKDQWIYIVIVTPVFTCKYASKNGPLPYSTDYCCCEDLWRTPQVLRNNLSWPNHAYSYLGFKKFLNVFLFLIGREASWPMRDFGTFHSK